MTQRFLGVILLVVGGLSLLPERPQTETPTQPTPRPDTRRPLLPRRPDP